MTNVREYNGITQQPKKVKEKKIDLEYQPRKIIRFPRVMPNLDKGLKSATSPVAARGMSYTRMDMK